ncbi:MAG TPA: 4'-phosphopantetheinyl transferase superfamily protein [Patescibacteria group bacterium]|nr:4'-phosphopantetheinyl transferase superfamily protein [Patescibacteria group bacterium]
MQVWGVRLISADLEQNYNADLLTVVDPSLQEEIRRFRRREDAVRKLTGDRLARLVVGRMLGIPGWRLDFAVNAYGKPFLAADTDIEFNLSHSGDWVVCAVDEQPVGIDVEQVLPVEQELMENCFSAPEIQWVRAGGSAWLTRFYQIWTLKESYIKALGQGMSLPLPSFSLLRQDDERWTLQSAARKTDWFFRQYSLPGGYELAVCGKDSGFSGELTQLTLKELLADE